MTQGALAWVTPAMEPLRKSGRAFFCSDGPDVPAGFWRFAAPDAEPLGPFRTATEAEMAGDTGNLFAPASERESGAKPHLAREVAT